MDIAQLAALKGMSVSKTAFDTIGQNVSNVNNEDYNAKKLNLGTEVADGEGYGVSISSITRNVDKFLQREVRHQQSLLAEDEVVDRYHKRIQTLFGQPTASGTLDDEINQFFNAVNFVSNNPDFKLQVVQRADALAHKLSTMADSLYQIQYDADQEILSQVNTLNQKLLDLEKLQESINSSTVAGADNTSLLDNRDRLVSDISEILDVSTYEQENRNVSVTARGGISLYDGTPYLLSYYGSSGPQMFKENLEIPPVKVYSQGNNPNSDANPELITGGKVDEIETKISSGKLAGLLRMRDQDVPEIINQLDLLASKIRDEVNRVHNSAGSVPSSNILTGTREVNANDFNQFTGQVRIGMIDIDGKPIRDEDGYFVNPLTIDLSKLDSGKGEGSIKTQTLIDEINQYFYRDPIMDRTEMGSFEDIRIASSTDNMVANGVFDFDFEVFHNGNDIATFTVDNIEVLDNTNTTVPGALTGGTIPHDYIANPGDRTRTGNFQVDFSGGAGGPYTIRSTIKVTESDGTIYSSVVDYEIDDTPAGGPDIMNDRYVANAVNSGDAQIIPASTPLRYMKAAIVNEDGLEVPAGESGFLQLKSLSKNYGIIIDDLNSNEQGYTYSSGLKVEATDRGFGHYFELNNLFTENGQVRNSALNMGVREDIKQNSNLLSMGKLAQSPSYIEEKIVGDEQASTILEFASGNPSLGSTITVNGRTFTIVAAAGSNDQITQGATLGDTVDNIAAVLGSINSYTSGFVDKASYSSDGVNKLTITHNAPGTSGNSFGVSYNLLGGSTASMNDSAFITSNSDFLKGGIDKSEAVTIQPNSYEIGVGSTQAMVEIAEVSTTNFEFVPTRWLSRINTTISGFAATLTAIDAGFASQAEQEMGKQRDLYQAFYEKFREGSGVDLDFELASTSIYQNSYAAAANILATSNRLHDILMQVMR